MTDRRERIPMVVLTGFLGSGKTTLLSRLLDDPAMGNAAVLVNELGEVALDHELLRHVGERTVVLPNGCVCCTLRDDPVAVADATCSTSPTAARLTVSSGSWSKPPGWPSRRPILNTVLADPIVGAALPGPGAS